MGSVLWNTSYDDALRIEPDAIATAAFADDLCAIVEADDIEDLQK